MGGFCLRSKKKLWCSYISAFSYCCHHIQRMISNSSGKLGLFFRGWSDGTVVRGRGPGPGSAKARAGGPARPGGPRARRATAGTRSRGSPRGPGGAQRCLLPSAPVASSELARCCGLESRLRPPGFFRPALLGTVAGPGPRGGEIEMGR